MKHEIAASNVLRILIVLISLLFSLGCTSPHWARVTVDPLGPDPRVPSEVDYGDMYVYAQINGEQFRMLLDTGAPIHSLTTSAAERAGLMADGELTVKDYAGDRARYTVAPVESMRVGPVVMRGFNMVITPDRNDPEFDGVLGMLGLQAFTLMLDFSTGVVDITDVRLDPRKLGVMPLRPARGGKLQVPVELIDADGSPGTIWALLDTGHNGRLLLDRDASRRYADPGGLFYRDRATGTHGTGWVVDKHRLHGDIVLGGIRYTGVTGGVDQASNNIGVGMLEGCRVTIDWPSRLIMIERVDGAVRLVDCMSLGIFDIVVEPSGARAFTMPGLLLEQSGLNHNRLVRTINGEPADERFDRAWLWPVHPDATQVVIEHADPDTGNIETCVIPIGR